MGVRQRRLAGLRRGRQRKWTCAVVTLTCL
jgi:hypothetical protein